MIPANAKIITDGRVVSKTIKETYDYNGNVLSSELVSFELAPNMFSTEVANCAVSYYGKANHD